MICNYDSSPKVSLSYLASANKFLTFSSDLPTYADIISGPFTIFGSTEEFKALESFLAIKVLPVPGGP